MPANEKMHPVDLQLLGAEAIVQISNSLPDLVEQADGLQLGVAEFHKDIYTCIKNSIFVCDPINKRVSGDFYVQVKPQPPS